MNSNDNELGELSQHLFLIHSQVPTDWDCNPVDKDSPQAKEAKRIQLFNIPTFYVLNDILKSCDPNYYVYLRRKWFLYKCSKCDEYLFSKHPSVTPNPNPKSKESDFTINDHKYDLKSTRIPSHRDVSVAIESPQRLVNHFFLHQSQGVRYGIQNRLFIVHHSFVNSERENFLRCQWRLREFVFKYFCDNIDNVSIFKFDGLNNKGKHICVNSSVIYILERNCGYISVIIPGLPQLEFTNGRFQNQL